MISKDILPDTLGGNMDIEEAMDSELLKRLLERDSPYEGNSSYKLSIYCLI